MYAIHSSQFNSLMLLMKAVAGATSLYVRIEKSKLLISDSTVCL